ncbi:TonB-dependent receptor plug domain-containing protein [Saccharicrinis aurantiacus]|uniref:TonB-dependent receptor plug domain-containing protein n=1 Tax=Saccharicrinis aurantiacus TaxID=1849719 RepID=UPI0024935EEE|nr:TonB-dependent receptor plug domain-containing protein [Saccharicrinis aurantiacus]
MDLLLLKQKCLNKYILITVLLSTLYCSNAIAQSYTVNCEKKPLNQVLIELRERDQLQFSFDDNLLSQFDITINAEFNSSDQLVSRLIENLPLKYEKSGEVFVIYPFEVKTPKKVYSCSGQLLEKGSGNPLPFSHVLINNYNTVTDVKGVFVLPESEDSIFKISASHLGCYMLDTTVTSDTKHLLYLTPASIGLKEITIQQSKVNTSYQLGEQSGLTKLNHYIAKYLPGNGDNSVFNLLRLQPGILAAGEQSNDLVIWGSAEGTSRVIFDGFTIWGLRTVSDNISTVNPYLAKNIEVMKGGYDVQHGDMSGGIVNIIGSNGNQEKAGANLFVNNQTLNAMVEVPIFKKSSMMLAYRQSYKNLIDANSIRFVERYNSNPENVYPLDVKPDYQFYDINLKYTLQGDNKDLFFVSLLTAKDNFSYFLNQEREKSEIKENSQEDNKQNGGTIFYGKTWKNGNSSDIKLSYSSLNSDVDKVRGAYIFRKDVTNPRRDDSNIDNVSELELRSSHNFLISKVHNIQTGLALIENRVVLQEDSFSYNLFKYEEQDLRFNGFIQDAIKLGARLELKAGLRFNYSSNVNKIYCDPRASLHYKANSRIKLNFAIGKYHQFLVKSSVVDDDGSYKYSWVISDNSTIPVMLSNHTVAGITYSHKGFTASMESFYKKNEGQTRYVKTRKLDDVFIGKSRSYGIDFLVKKEFKKHNIWASYSLGKTEELFSYFRDEEYRRAPQDQRHELKLAGLFSIRDFYMSGNYVYGSGLPYYTSFSNPEYTETPYNRFDISLIYKFNISKLDTELGLSILNVFDTDNTKYSSFERIPYNQLSTIFTNSESIPFTPLLYLKMQL